MVSLLFPLLLAPSTPVLLCLSIMPPHRCVPAPLGRDCPVPGSLQRLRRVVMPQELSQSRVGWCPLADPHGSVLGRAEGFGPPHAWGFVFQGCLWPLTSLHTPKSWQARLHAAESSQRPFPFVPEHGWVTGELRQLKTRLGAVGCAPYSNPTLGTCRTG